MDNKINSDKFQLADSLRELISEVVSCDAPDEIFIDAANTIDDLKKQLTHVPKRSREVGLRKDAEGNLIGFDYGMDMAYYSPLSGSANPLSPPIKMHLEDDAAVGLLNFPISFEGPPGLAHGGYIAAAFDELFGLTISLLEKPCMTGRLSVRYKSPCPLNADLNLKAHIETMKGRRVITAAVMHAGDQLIAEAEALFIVVDEDMYKGFAEMRDTARE